MELDGGLRCGNPENGRLEELSRKVFRKGWVVYAKFFERQASCHVMTGMVFRREISRAVSLPVINKGEYEKGLEEKMGKPEQGEANVLVFKEYNGGWFVSTCIASCMISCGTSALPEVLNRFHPLIRQPECGAFGAILGRTGLNHPRESRQSEIEPAWFFSFVLTKTSALILSVVSVIASRKTMAFKRADRKKTKLPSFSATGGLRIDITARDRGSLSDGWAKRTDARIS